VRVIAIDGLAASGKSSTARAVARRLGWAHLDSGALYRAVTLAVLDHLDETERASGQRARDLAVRLPVRLARDGEAFFPSVAGVDVSGPIRSARVTGAVSQVAALGAVREWATEEIRRAVREAGGTVVVDGRDIGTVVFPEAPLKVFLTASPSARAERRLVQDGQGLSAEEVRAEAARLEQRDATDRGRAAAPLREARDAVVLDTTETTFPEQVDVIVALARKVFGD